MDMPPICIWLVTFHFCSMPWLALVALEEGSSNVQYVSSRSFALIGTYAGCMVGGGFMRPWAAVDFDDMRLWGASVIKIVVKAAASWNESAGTSFGKSSYRQRVQMAYGWFLVPVIVVFWLGSK